MEHHGRDGQRKLCFLRVSVLLWNKYPTQFNLNKVKRKELKSVIMQCENWWTSQTGFYSIRISTLNTLSFHCKLGKIAIRKNFPLKFFHKRVFPWQYDNTKRKHALTFFNENKMILAHCTLNFFSCNAKQEINLTLPHM